LQALQRFGITAAAAEEEALRSMRFYIIGISIAKRKDECCMSRYTRKEVLSLSKAFSDTDKIIVDAIMETGSAIEASAKTGIHYQDMDAYIAQRPHLKHILSLKHIIDIKEYCEAALNERNELATAYSKIVPELEEASDTYKECYAILKEIPADNAHVRTQILLAMDLIRQNKYTAASNILFRLGLDKVHEENSFRYELAEYIRDMYLDEDDE